MEILDLDWRVVVLQSGAFILLLIVLKRYMFVPIRDMLEVRKQEIANTYSVAERERESMEEIRRSYEKRLEGIEQEAHAKMQAAVKEAHSIRDEIIADARARAEAVLARGEAELLREREKAVVELREDVANLVVGASSRLLDRSMDDEAHRKLVDDFISSLGTAK